MTSPSTLAILCIVVVGLTGPVPVGLADSFDISQLSFNLNDTIFQDTEWGTLTVSFPNPTTVKYLNLSTPTGWALENVPLFAPAAAGEQSELRCYFDLGIARGTPISNLNVGFSITDSPLASAPSPVSPVPVSPATNVFYQGLSDHAMLNDIKPAVPVQAAATAGTKAMNIGFPILEQGNHECAPTAVLASLMFLNDMKAGVNVPAGDLNIDKAKAITNWAPNGCPSEGPNDWVKKKDTETRGYGITTRTLEFQNATAAQRIARMRELIAQMGDDQDIELDIKGHTTALVGLAEMVNGKFCLITVDDPAQGKDANPEQRAGLTVDIYDPTSNVMHNRPYKHIEFGDTFIYRAIIECPEPTAMALFMVAALPLLARHRRR